MIVCHNLQVYQKVLVLDLDYALDKKVEQDLWNVGFKQQIEALQVISKDRKVSDRLWHYFWIFDVKLPLNHLSQLCDNKIIFFQFVTNRNNTSGDWWQTAISIICVYKARFEIILKTPCMLVLVGHSTSGIIKLTYITK